MKRTTRRSFLAKGAAAATAGGLIPGSLLASPTRRIVPGVWFRTGDFLTAGQSNSAVIEMKEYLVVVDANSPSGAASLVAEVKDLSPKPVKYVLLTHHHGDHIYGNATWTRAGATTVAHASMLGELARLEPQRWRRDPALAQFGDAPQPPSRTFSEDVWTLDDGTRRIEARYLGPAHTRDDIAIYLPAEQVLACGDIAIHTSLNSFFDCDFPNWIEVLKKLSILPVKHVLPGHGEPSTSRLLDLQRRFLEELRGAALAANASGTKPSEAARSLRFPEELQPWVGPSLARQLTQVCAALQ